LSMKVFSLKKMNWHILLLLLFNPLITLLVFSTKSGFPDTFAYIAQAENLSNALLFHTGPWGHIDSSMTLAPLYPLLIALLMKIGVDGLNAAIYISLVAGFIFSVLSYYFILEVARPVIAMSTVLALNTTYIYFDFFSTALTESVFLLVLLAALFSISRMIIHLPEKKQAGVLSSGVLCAAAIFTREIGITIFLATVILFLLNYIHLRKVSRSAVLKKAGVFLLVFFMLLIPYQIIRYYQTNASPLTQSFRLEQYTVRSDKQDLIKNIEQQQKYSGSYLDIYKTRRELMRLLPDSSEMLNYVIYDKNGTGTLNVFSRLTNYPSRVFNNIMNLSESMEKLLFLLFVLSCVSILIPTTIRMRRVRILIPCFLIVYIALISFFTDKVPRYIDVLIPFILLHVCMEIIVLASLIDERKIKRVTIELALFFLCPAIVIAGSNDLFYKKKIFPHNQQLDQKLNELHKFVEDKPVFTQFPYLSYAIGGQYRLLPNDSLEKVVRYGNLTDTHWLLIVDVPEERNTMQYWSIAFPWMLSSDLERSHPELVHYCCGFHDSKTESDWRLYEIQSTGSQDF
jgi:dolichyl-phosphate-mannose-protein mannosyltransferase